MAADTFRFAMAHDSDEPLAEIPCPRCASLVEVHMPDPTLPDRMLATCQRCKSWYVMDLAASTLSLVCAPTARASSPAPRNRQVQDAKRARIG